MREHQQFNSLQTFSTNRIYHRTPFKPNSSHVLGNGCTPGFSPGNVPESRASHRKDPIHNAHFTPQWEIPNGNLLQVYHHEQNGQNHSRASTAGCDEKSGFEKIQEINPRLSASKPSFFHEGLPPALSTNNNLVSNNFTTYSQAGPKYQVHDSGIRSLPNSGSKEAPNYYNSRTVLSAPGKRNSLKTGPQHLPKLNNLVEGKLQKQYQNDPLDTNRASKPFPVSYQGNNKQPPTIRRRAEPAGVSTKCHVQQIEASNKFATSWANERIGHFTRKPDNLSQEQSLQNGRQDTDDTKNPKLSTGAPSVSKYTKSTGKESQASKPSYPTTNSVMSQNAFSVITRKSNLDKNETTIKASLPEVKDKLGIYYADRKNKKPKTHTNPKLGFKRAIPPWKVSNKEHILTKGETKMYKHIAKVYGEDIVLNKKNRQEKFFRRLECLQEGQTKKDNLAYREAKEREEQTKNEHMRQLKRLRTKFQDEQLKRFMSQYVTTKVLSSEYQDRSVYGLPETLNQPYHAPLKPKILKPKDFDSQEQHTINMKRFAKLFNIHRGPCWEKDMKPPKMNEEYIIEDDNGKPLDVQQIVNEALKLLDNMYNYENEETPRNNSRPGKPKSILKNNQQPVKPSPKENVITKNDPPKSLQNVDAETRNNTSRSKYSQASTSSTDFSRTISSKKQADEHNKKRETLAAFKFKTRFTESANYRPTSDFRLLSETDNSLSIKEEPEEEKKPQQEEKLQPQREEEVIPQREKKTQSEQEEIKESLSKNVNNEDQPKLTQDALRKHDSDHGTIQEEKNDDFQSTIIDFSEDKAIDNKTEKFKDVSNFQEQSEINTSSKQSKRSVDNNSESLQKYEYTSSRKSTGKQSYRSVHTLGSKSVRIDNNTSVEPSVRRASVSTWAEEPSEQRGPSRNRTTDVEIQSINSFNNDSSSLDNDLENAKNPLNTSNISYQKDDDQQNNLNHSSEIDLKKSSNNLSVSSKLSKSANDSATVAKVITPVIEKKMVKNQSKVNSKEEKSKNSKYNSQDKLPNFKEGKQPIEAKESTKPAAKQNLKTASKDKNTKTKVPLLRKVEGKKATKEMHKGKVVFKVKGGVKSKPQHNQAILSTVNNTDIKTKPTKVVSAKTKASTSETKINKRSGHLPPKPDPISSINKSDNRIDLESLSSDDSMDIFELARKRYGIVLDSDEESTL